MTYNFDAELLRRLMKWWRKLCACVEHSWSNKKGDITASEHDPTMLDCVFCLYVCMYVCVICVCVCVGNTRLASSTDVRGTGQDKQIKRHADKSGEK